MAKKPVLGGDDIAEPMPNEQGPEVNSTGQSPEVNPTEKSPEVTSTEQGPEVTPTEQLPMESAPVSATAAASGGATGLDPETLRGTAWQQDAGATAGSGTNPSMFRRHPLATGVAAGAIAVILISGLTAWGVGTAVATSLTSSNSSAMPMPTGSSTPAPAAGSGAGTGTGAAGTRVAFRATIQSVSGDTWTIVTHKGTTVTLTVTSSTQFGTRKSAETSGSFAVGDSVVIVAMRGADGTPTATRVVTAGMTAGGSTPTAAPTQTPNT